MSRQIVRIVVLLLLVAGMSGWWFTRASGGKTVGFRTEKVVLDDLRATISASGTLEPEDVVDVGAQVVGQIVSFGDDQTKKDKSDSQTSCQCPGQDQPDNVRTWRSHGNAWDFSFQLKNPLRESDRRRHGRRSEGDGRKRIFRFPDKIP